MINEDEIMKKVSLITLQNVPNYGSVLQCYATEQIIRKIGYEIETINYLPERMTKLGMLKAIKDKKDIFSKSFVLRNIARIVIYPSYIKRFYIFNKFRKKYLIQTKKQFKNNNELKKYFPRADIYCTGSDQVWNSKWNGGIDKAMFLDFVPKDKKCIAYSASFGKNKLEFWEIQETKQLLKKYKNISVREKSATEILYSLGYASVQVVDPTLLLNGNEWRKISSNKYSEDSYILVYNLNRNKKIDKYAENLSKKTGLKIRFLSYQFHEFYKKGKIMCNPKVEDFLSLIDNAQYVITDSFHATAFSLNFNTQFIIVYPGKYSTRLQSILEITGLENRVAKDENDLSIVSEKIDFEKVNKVIDKERNHSIEWLKNALV